MIPPFVQQIVGVVVRVAVVFLAGWVAAHGGPTYTNDQIAKAVTEIVPVVAILLWSFYQKYHGRQKLLTALASNAGTSENHVEMLVSQGQAPSVMTPKHEAPTLQGPAQ
jgi:hypothetical protein